MYKRRCELAQVSYCPIKYFGFESHIYQKSILVLIDDKRAVMTGIDVCTWQFCVH